MEMSFQSLRLCGLMKWTRVMNFKEFLFDKQLLFTTGPYISERQRSAEGKEEITLVCRLM